MRRIERDGGFFFLCVKKIHFHHMSMCVCLRRRIYIRVWCCWFSFGTEKKGGGSWGSVVPTQDNPIIFLCVRIVYRFVEIVQ